MQRTLRDTIRQIRESKGWTQREMAMVLGVDFQDVQRAENAGRNLEKTFSLVLKLLPICIELDLIGEHDLLPRKRDSKNTQHNLKAGAAKAGQGRQV